MNKRIVFRHMEKTAGIEEHCNKQLAKIEKFLEKERTPISIDLVLEPSKVHSHHKIELRVNTPHFHKISTDEGPKFYEVLDSVIDTMYRELHKENDKQNEHNRELNRHDDMKKNR
jgi:ribosomal subunit interface protein